MPQGLQVFDASGNIVVDLTTRVGRVLGIGSYGTTNGSLTDSNLLTGTGFYYGIPGPGGSATYMPTFSISGSTLSWTWVVSGSGSNVAGNVVYGVY